MRCPKCWGQVLKIEVQFQGFVTVFFDEANKCQLTKPVSITSQWEDDSPCACEECEWTGTVGDAMATGESSAWERDDIS